MTTLIIMMILTNAALVFVNILTLKSIREEVRKLLKFAWNRA